MPAAIFDLVYLQEQHLAGDCEPAALIDAGEPRSRRDASAYPLQRQAGLPRRAITIDLDNDTVGQAPISGPGYTITVVGNPTVQNTSVDGLHAAPDGDTSNYLAIQGGQTVTIHFDQLQSFASFLWGSPDDYNHISFFGRRFPFYSHRRGTLPGDIYA